MSVNALVLAVSHHFQVYDGQSSFINNMMLNSNISSNFGLPVDNISTDTTVAVSSRYFYKSWSLVDGLYSRLEFIRSCYDYKSRLALAAHLQGSQPGVPKHERGCVSCELW